MVFYTFCDVIENARVLENTQIWQKLRCDWKVLVERLYSTDLYMAKTKYIFTLSIWKSYLGREQSTIVCLFWRSQEKDCQG